jgi:succinyl-CoA synthetase beta subunit
MHRPRIRPVLAAAAGALAGVAPVAELFVGGRIDPDFGPLVLVGAGGVLVELYRDVSVRLAPIDEDTALEALGATRISRVLDGFRGRPPGDRRAAARAISALSGFVADFADELSEVEINPLAVLPDGRGVCALDCVLVRKGSDAAEKRPDDAGGDG